MILVEKREDELVIGKKMELNCQTARSIEWGRRTAEAYRSGRLDDGPATTISPRLAC
jgi:hypothetical protein